MKSILWIIGLCVCSLVPGCGSKQSEVRLDGPTIVEAACGQCQLGLMGKKGCDLAIRHEGKSFFVDGYKITDLEKDNHAADGMCSVVRKARVSGQIAGGRFAATAFELLPASP